MPRQVAFDQCNVCRLDGDVGAGTHGDTDIGGRQCRSVVDAVARHRHYAALGLELNDPGVFIVGRTPA